MGINIELLAKYVKLWRSSHEQKIRNCYQKVTPLADEVRIDNMGNVTAIKKGEKKKK